MLSTTRTPEDRQRLIGCVAMLCEAVGRTPSKATYLAYEIGLDGVPVDDIEAAAAAALQRPDRWMPTPGQLRELAGATQANAADRASLAFDALRVACARVGSYRSPDFDDPLINAVVRHLGGWTRACDLPVSEFNVWYRKEFVAAYEMFARIGVAKNLAAPLAGESEESNLANGYEDAAARCRVEIRTGLPWAGKPVPLLAGESQRLALEGPR